MSIPEPKVMYLKGKHFKIHSVSQTGLWKTKKKLVLTYIGHFWLKNDSINYQNSQFSVNQLIAKSTNHSSCEYNEIWRQDESNMYSHTS